MSESPFTVYLSEKFEVYKNLASHGRRKAKLSLLEEFWALPSEERKRLTIIADDEDSSSILSDAQVNIDAEQGPEEKAIDVLVDGSAVGLVIRTDYSDDAAWLSFVEAVKSAEKDLAAPDNEDLTEEAPNEPSTSILQVEIESASESDSELDDEIEIEAQGEGSTSRTSEEDDSLFAFVSPPTSSPLRSGLVDASNLAVLRIFNDVTVSRSPSLPAGSRPLKPGHRLMDNDGLIEVYEGTTIWIYDERSNRDRAARLVSLRADSYGAATGDSWRARASFLPELQLSLASGTITIDFGGLDRWDYNERQRNLTESNRV